MNYIYVESYERQIPDHTSFLMYSRGSYYKITCLDYPSFETERLLI